MILAKKVDYGQKMRVCEKEVGNFSTSKCARNCIFVFFCQKNKFGEQQPLLKPPQNLFHVNLTISYFQGPPRVVGG